MVTPDYTELERLAKAALGLDMPDVLGVRSVEAVCCGRPRHGECCGLPEQHYVVIDVHGPMAAFVDAVHPPVILALFADHAAQAARIKELEAALKPFADEGRVWSGHIEPSKTINGEATLLTAGHLFAASKAMEGK